MANRFWVGGTNTWNATAGSKWSTTSGGSGGAAVPTSFDDVFFDGNSGSGVVTISGTVVCNSLTLTSFAGTFAGSSSPGVGVGGGGGGGGGGAINLAGKSFVAGQINVTMFGGPITSGGGSLYSLIANGGESLVDALTCSSSLELGGTFAASDQNVTCASLTLRSSADVTAGSGTWTVAGSVTVNTSATISAGTSTFKITGAGTFAGGGKTYNNVWFAANNTVTGSSTFANLKIDPGVTVTFTAGTTTTVSSLTWDGTPSSVVTVQSSSAGSAWNLSDSAGSNVVSYCSIKDSAAAGGAAFTALSATNVSGNSGWTFTSAGGGLLFFL